MKAQEVVEEFLVLVAKGELEQAQEFIIEQSQGREDTIAEHLYYVGVLSFSDARLRVAMSSFEAALKIALLESMKEQIRANLADTYDIYANLSFDMGKFDEAEEFFEKSLETDPEYNVGHFNYGCFLSAMGRYEEAEEQYRKAIEVKPEFLSAYVNLGNLLSAMGRYEEAEGQYKKAIKLGINDARVHYNYALLLKDTNRYSEAEEQYKRALEIDPEYFPARNNLVFLLRKMNRFDEADEFVVK